MTTPKHKDHSSETPAAPRLSIIMPTYNRRERLERVLRSLAQQDIETPFEVIVVSDGSTDGTDEYLTDGPLPLQVSALSQENQGPAAARNLGIAHATGELVLFLDDDVVADRGLVRAHLDAHRRLGDDVVVIGPMLNPDDHTMSPWVAWEQEMLAKQYAAMDRGEFEATARQFYTGNASVRRRHVVDCGGFDVSFRRAEDVELAFRLADCGIRFHFERGAIGFHYADRSFEAWERTAYDYGRNDIVFARDRGRTWIYGFTRDAHHSRHPALRGIAAWAARADRRQRWLRGALRPMARTSARVPAVVRRFALSTIYAVAYLRGIADELGSSDALDRLIIYGVPPEKPAS